MSDKERIQMVMNHCHLNNVAFCNKVNLNQATLSNILSGRTNPSLPVLRSIADAFPEISTNWLFLGEGEMLKSESKTDNDASTIYSTQLDENFSTTPLSGSDDIFGPLSNFASEQPNHSTSPAAQQSSSKTALGAVRPVPQINVSDIVTGVVSQLQKPTRKIVEVRIFFDDGTYEAFS